MACDGARRRQAVLLFAALLAATLCSALAHADGRVALVIGNAAYRQLPVLDSPRSDATAVAAKLEQLGYAVIIGLDLDRAAMEAKLEEFWQATEHARIALFYYAGHGLQVSGRDYLVPVDAALTDAKDLDRSAIELTGAIAPLDYGPDIGLVLVDASRDNPLPAAVEIPSADGPGETPPGGRTVIAFATSPDRTAIRGRGDMHSPFTAALLQSMTAGVTIHDLLEQVRSTVLHTTRGGEIPWFTSNYALGRDIYLGGP